MFVGPPVGIAESLHSYDLGSYPNSSVVCFPDSIFLGSLTDAATLLKQRGGSPNLHRRSSLVSTGCYPSASVELKSALNISMSV